MGPSGLLQSGGVVHPPGAGGPMKLLDRIQCLLILCAMQESKLGLNSVDPVIHQQWIGGCVTKKYV
jgi:hypothetical protein